MNVFRLLRLSSTLYRQKFVNDSRYLSTNVVEKTETLFLNPRVQEILTKVTGFNLEDVYHEKKTTSEPPTYKLLTDEELQNLYKETTTRASEFLQMPPVMSPWKDDLEVISDDPEIAGHSEHKFVFTDITYGIADRDRTIVIREPDGLLRKASPREHDKIIQSYYPKPGYMYHTPEMLKAENLQAVLSRQSYEYVLDRACVQYEPDDPEFIRVNSTVYDHIDSNRAYQNLRSTRFFGGLAFYLVSQKKIDNFLVDMLQRGLISDAVDTVELYTIIHPESNTTKHSLQKTEKDLIQVYIDHDSKDKGMLELALQTCVATDGGLS